VIFDEAIADIIRVKQFSRTFDIDLMIANIQTAKRKVSVGINHSSICTRSRSRILSDRPVSKR